MSMKNKIPSDKRAEERTGSFKGKVALVAAVLICSAVAIGAWPRFFPANGGANSDSSKLSGNTISAVASSNLDIPRPVATTGAIPQEPAAVPAEQGVEPPLPAPPQAQSLLTTNSALYNVAWGVESADSLTIWMGALDKSGATLSDSKAIAKWDGQFKLRGISTSPDGRSIAVMFVSKSAVDETEGIFPNWVEVINLSTGSVQALPDYKHYDLYTQAYYGSPDAILGWRDNNTIVLQQIGAAPVVASIDGTSYSPVSFPQASVGQVALSPDGKTFFSSGIDKATSEYGWWLNNVDGTNPRQVGSSKEMRPLGNPTWSPDGRYVAFVSQRTEPTGSGSAQVVPGYRSIWILDVTTGKQQLVGSENEWNVKPTWSLDGKMLAFLQSNAPVANDGEAYTFPARVETTAVVAGITADGQSLKVAAPQRIGAAGRHSDLAWINNQSFFLSTDKLDTAGNLGATIVSGQPVSGSAFEVLSVAAGQTIAHPVFFGTNQR